MTLVNKNNKKCWREELIRVIRDSLVTGRDLEEGAKVQIPRFARDDRGPRWG
jgi:hypothetical protein